MSMAGEDLNLRPSGYETYAVCLTGFYGLTGFVRFVSPPGEMDAVRPDQENVT
jgi:hypothetical protein